TGTVTVPYVPTLGPVHPTAATVDVFEAVLGLEPGRFLPYDKDQRWADRKDETVLGEHTEHTAQRTIVTTLTRRRSGRITVYHYAHPPPAQPARETPAKLAAAYGAKARRVVWFQHTPPPSGVTYARALLAPTGKRGPDPDRPVLALSDCLPRVRDGFLEFCALASHGMAHLGCCWAEGRISAPILVAAAGAAYQV